MSTHPSRGCITWVQECAGQPVWSYLPRPVLVRDLEKCALLGCSSRVFGAPSSPLCQWEQCSLGKGRLRNGWALGGHCWALSQLLLAQIRGTIRAEWESQHCITMMLHQRYVQLWPVKGRKGVCYSTRKFCVTMRESIYMLLGLSSAPEERCCSDAKRGEPDCVTSFLPTWQLLNWNESAWASTLGTEKLWIKEWNKNNSSHWCPTLHLHISPRRSCPLAGCSLLQGSSFELWGKLADMLIGTATKASWEHCHVGISLYLVFSPGY